MRATRKKLKKKSQWKQKNLRKIKNFELGKSCSNLRMFFCFLWKFYLFLFFVRFKTYPYWFWRIGYVLSPAAAAAANGNPVKTQKNS